MFRSRCDTIYIIKLEFFMDAGIIEKMEEMY